jgi:hypothetical protein
MELTIEDVKKVKITRTFFQVVIHYFYSLVRRFIKYQKRIFNDFILYDNGMEISNSFIPYEYIVSFTNQELIILAKLEDDKIIPDDSFLQIQFKHKFNPHILKNHMYYHLKYNTVDDTILKYKSIKFSLTI